MSQQRRGFVQNDDLDIRTVKSGSDVGHEFQPILQHPRPTYARVDEHRHIDVAVGPRPAGGNRPKDVGRLYLGTFRCASRDAAIDGGTVCRGHTSILYQKYGPDVDLVFSGHPGGIAMVVSGEAQMSSYNLENLALSPRAALRRRGRQSAEEEQWRKLQLVVDTARSV